MCQTAAENIYICICRRLKKEQNSANYAYYSGLTKGGRPKKKGGLKLSHQSADLLQSKNLFQVDLGFNYLFHACVTSFV